MTTATNTVNVPYLVTTRSFQGDQTQLSEILTKSYSEIAQAMNRRTIGVYNKIQVVTGNQYFSIFNNDIHAPIQFRQSYRQVYTLDALPNTGTATIPTNISFAVPVTFVNIYGTAQSTGFAVPLTPYAMTPTDDAPYLRINLGTGNIEIITTSANWITYSAIIVLEYLLN
jgi:hypothetical protein